MRNFLASMVLGLLATFTASACLNSYSFEEDLAAMRSKPSSDVLNNRVREFGAAYKRNFTLESANDYAVALVLVGDYSKSIQVLKDLESKQPNQFRTAANLGTALELTGDNEQALVWIKEGIKRNPLDHKGTEWLHVKILEAKIALAKDKDWLKTNRVLGVSFGDGYQPAFKDVFIKDHLQRSVSLESASQAIEYQLQERLKFVTPPDAVVADLFFSLADLGLLKESASRESYKAAIEYGVVPKSIVEKRIFFNTLSYWAKDLLTLALILLFLFPTVVLAWSLLKKLYAWRNGAPKP